MADIVSFSEEKKKVKTKKKNDSGSGGLDMTLVNIVHELHIIRDHSKGALIPILSYVEGYRTGLEKSLRTEPLYSVLKKHWRNITMSAPKYKPKGDLFTQVTAAIPKPHHDVLRYVVYQTNASTAEVVRFLVCSHLQLMFPDLPEYEFEPGPNPPGLKKRY